MLKLTVTANSLRLIAIDIDGTLLNPEFRISETDLATLRRAHAQGIEVILVTGRRHTFALPIAQQLGFDLWLICSNGAITRSLSTVTCCPHLPVATLSKECKNFAAKPF
jgi:HAD superfamily hydrolase (TIGR01484 family)